MSLIPCCEGAMPVMGSCLTSGNDSPGIENAGSRQAQTPWINEIGTVMGEIETFLTILKHADFDGLNPEDYQYSKIQLQWLKFKGLHSNDTVQRKLLSGLLNKMLDQAFITYSMHQLNGCMLNEVDNSNGRQIITARALRDSLYQVMNMGGLKNMLEGFVCPMPLYKQYKVLLAALMSQKNAWACTGSSIVMLNSPGTVTKMTLLDTQILLVRMNMERCRWYGREFNDTQIVVNVPSSILHLNVGNKCILQMKVIAGTLKHQTPLLMSRIEHIVIHPYWNIPPGIVSREILPAIKKNRSYLSVHHIRIIRNGHVKRYRQDPGPWNALGEIKFTFPNRHLVYLHDTPHKELFQKESRFFSNGCVRIEKPRELAAALLGVDSLELTNMMNQVDINSESKIPYLRHCDVLFAYWTIEFDEMGCPVFLKDIYGKDRRMMTLMTLGAR